MKEIELLTEQLTTIDEVIESLEDIIQKEKKCHSPLGYFTALYQEVTIRVKEGISNGVFEDGPRMEHLDVTFALRYLDAYQAYHQGLPCSLSWVRAFDASKDSSLIVLQHLLLGMNAHINLDLGIASAEVMKGKDLKILHNDFNKINEILSSLVNKVQQDLTEIWSPLRWILRLSGRIDNLVVDFSMTMARDGAWSFAQSLFGVSVEKWQVTIGERDKEVARLAQRIVHPRLIVQFILWVVRITGKGSVARKIGYLQD